MATPWPTLLDPVDEIQRATFFSRHKKKVQPHKFMFLLRYLLSVVAQKTKQNLTLGVGVLRWTTEKPFLGHYRPFSAVVVQGAVHFELSTSEVGRGQPHAICSKERLNLWFVLFPFFRLFPEFFAFFHPCARVVRCRSLVRVSSSIGFYSFRHK